MQTWSVTPSTGINQTKPAKITAWGHTRIDWTITVKNASGQMVDSWTVKNEHTLRKQWTPDTNLPNGTYTITLDLVTKDGFKVTSLPKTVTVVQKSIIVLFTFQGQNLSSEGLNECLISYLIFNKNKRARVKTGALLFYRQIQKTDLISYTPYESGSTIIGSAVVNGLVVEAIKIMIENNFTPPIFKSGNADDSTRT
ncbi:hypothetical protein [Neobacillus sp. CF12]|uniref:hypothetical protein n=1 Tax=Neobacillus sp. CF12 TaxID=3055864 RepID=UPI0025A0F67F|nr:hypothetical protein [Neobacillus sp. CF12]MDM5331615.1 hypothetical protein [Neobacillus sp. CF12]